MTGLAHVANDPANLQSVIEIIDRDGGVIVDDYISAEVLDSIKSDLLPMIAKQKTGADDFFGKRTRRMSRLFARTRHCAGIILNPLFLESARHFICKPRLAWAGDQQYEINCQVNIGVSQLIQIGPGKGLSRSIEMMPRSNGLGLTGKRRVSRSWSPFLTLLLKMAVRLSSRAVINGTIIAPLCEKKPFQPK